MNWDIVSGIWKQFIGMLQVRRGNYTHNQFDVIDGKRLLLAGRIQEDCGVTAEEAERQIKHFARRNKDYRHKSSS